MDVHNEVGPGLKASLLMFVLILIGTLVYFVIRQNKDLGQIYAQDDAVTTHHGIFPTSVDTPTSAP